MEINLNLFSFDDYRAYLKAYLGLEKNLESGERKKLLLSTGISTSLLTQILSERKQMSSEQAYEISLYLRFTDKETDYFLLLVEFSRAGTVKLQQRIIKKMKLLQSESKKVKSKVTSDIALSDEEKATYYSSWLYTAVRNLAPTQSGKTIATISSKLNLPEEKIQGVVQFLIDLGLIVATEKGFEYRAGYTHLDATHPLVFRHHQNWRQRAIHQMDHYKETHLHYTCPMAISKETAKEMRGQFMEVIKSLNQSIRHEEPDVSYCLNVDFFEY